MSDHSAMVLVQANRAEIVDDYCGTSGEAAAIVAALRVKNEERWLADVLKSVAWCKAIYLFNDHSDDRTAEIAKEHGAEVIESPFAGLDEARDKEYLVEHIEGKHPKGTWVLMIDGDEILQSGGEQIIRRCVGRKVGAWSYTIEIRYLWNSRDTIRVDGVYGRFKRPSLFKLIGQHEFRRSGREGNLHPSCAPVKCRLYCQSCSAILWHLGYMDKADRVRKWHYYNELDPRNTAEGYDPKHPERRSYPHMVQGDVPEVPADALLRHGGPLKLEKIERI